MWTSRAGWIDELTAWADTEAGRNGRVVQMDESQILAFGPEVGLVLGALARSIYA